MKSKLNRYCSVLSLSCLLTSLLSSVSFASGLIRGDLERASRAWLSDPTLEMPADIQSVEPLSEQQAKAATRSLWKLYQSEQDVPNKKRVLPEPHVIDQLNGTLPDPSELKTGDKTMPFRFLQRGTSKKSMPLFIALHGGGRAAVDGPHTWPVNTREWQVQMQFAATIYPDNALYFVPRMADDRDGRWYFSYCQDAYEKVIRDAIRHHNVNPNRVYLIGISEGAYTAYRMGAFMADRWAGAGSMAGGEPLGNAPPENMRNLAFRADIGERDTMFDRLGMNRRYGEALARLKQDDASGYNYWLEVHQGRGHGIEYSACPQWLYQFERNPWPERVRWVNIDVHGRRRMQSYWLALDEVPNEQLEFDAHVDRKDNTIVVSVARREGETLVPDKTTDFHIYLNDAMLDLDQSVRLVCNGEEVFNAAVERRLSTMLKTLVERGDPHYCFPAVVTVDRE